MEIHFKKITILMIFILSTLSLISLSVATEVSERESYSFQNQFGLEMRFHQLLSDVESKIDSTEFIIEQFEDNVSSEIINRSEAIQEDFISIKEQLEFENKSAQNFVAYRKEINELTREFRELVSNEFTQEEIQTIREGVQIINQEYRESRRETIQELRKESNLDILRRIYGEDEQFDELSRLYLNDSISLGEFRSTSQRNVVEQRREEIQQQRNEIREQAQIRSQELRERAEIRREEIQQRNREIRESIRDRRDKRIDRREQIRDAIQRPQISDREYERIERDSQEIRDRIRERTREYQIRERTRDNIDRDRTRDTVDEDREDSNEQERGDINE